jgi:hypothetical protein
MKTLILLAVFAFPQTHIEHGKATIREGGQVSVPFHSKFDAMPKCQLVGKIPPGTVIRTWSREWVEITGKKGDKVSWRCE